MEAATITHMNEDKRQEILRRHQKVEETDQEIAIRCLLEETLTSDEVSKSTFRDFKTILISYFKNSINDIDHPNRVHDKTQEVLQQISTRGNATVVSGEEFLTSDLISKPVFLATNHLGLYKLVSIDPLRELGLKDTGINRAYPLPIFHASNYPVAERLNNKLYIAAYEFPGILGEIQKDAGGVIIKLKEELDISKEQSGIEVLINETVKFFQIHPNAALSILPEGKTSGKSSGRSPYDLEKFRTGAFVVAAQLEIPIVPVAQRFVNNRFELGILKPIYLSNTTRREEFSRIASQTQNEMQNWLKN